MKIFGLWINGAEVGAAAGATFDVENPAHRQVLARVAEGRAEDVDTAVAAAKKAFETWGRTSATERFHLLRGLAALITAKADDLARWETLATGRPIRKMAAQVARLSDFFEYVAATARVAEGEVGFQAYRASTQTQAVVVTLTDEPCDWYGGGTRYS